MATDAEYRIALDRLRRALAGSPLSGAAIRVGLLMIHFVNRDLFLERGIACSWVGVDRLARETGLSRRGAQKGRQALARVGAIVLERKGGHGEADTDHYAFSLGWAGSVETKIKEGAQRALESPRANRRSLYLRRYPTRPRAALGPGLERTIVGEQGEQLRDSRANGHSPEPLEVNPLIEPFEDEKAAFQDGAGKKAEHFTHHRDRDHEAPMLGAASATPSYDSKAA